MTSFFLLIQALFAIQVTGIQRERGAPFGPAVVGGAQGLSSPWENHCWGF